MDNPLNMGSVIEKVAEKHPDLQTLLLAKELSDKKKYIQKNELLRHLLHKAPNDFAVSEPDNGGIVGISHLPTNFKIHTLTRNLPESLKQACEELTEKHLLKEAAATRIAYLMETETWN